MKTLKYIFIIVACFLSFSPSIRMAQAQVSLPSSIDGVTISADINSPAPGQNVEIKVESYNTDLNRASITWLENGKTVDTGTGKKTLTVAAPTPGKELKVTAIITTVEGRAVNKTISVISGDIEIVIEPDAYTPPFFKGKPPYIYNQNLKIIAVPHLVAKNGAPLDPSKLVYKWKRDYNVLGDQSGYGRQVLLYKSGLVPRPVSMTVEVSSLDDGVLGEKTVNLEATDGSLLFYEEDPLYGVMYNTAVGDRFNLKQQEVRFLAIPFGFNREHGDQITYAWSVNNVENPDLGSTRSLTLRAKDGAEGSSIIGLDVRNGYDILQGAKASFTAYFSQKKLDNQVTF